MQWLIIALLIAFIYFAYFRKPRVKTARKNRDEASDIMIECEKCGVFTSDKEVLLVDGKFYCSKECAQIK